MFGSAVRNTLLTQTFAGDSNPVTVTVWRAIQIVHMTFQLTIVHQHTKLCGTMVNNLGNLSRQKVLQSDDHINKPGWNQYIHFNFNMQLTINKYINKVRQPNFLTTAPSLYPPTILFLNQLCSSTMSIFTEICLLYKTLPKCSRIETCNARMNQPHHHHYFPHYWSASVGHWHEQWHPPPHYHDHFSCPHHNVRTVLVSKSDPTNLCI